MKIKHQLAIFNALTRLLIILVLWLALPVLVEKVIYRHIDKSLQEKKHKFIQHLDKAEINDFLIRNDSTETYASFSTLHNEFLFLSQPMRKTKTPSTVFINEPRIIEAEESDFRILQYNFTYEKTAYQLEIGSSLSEINDLTFIIRLFVLIVLVIIVIVTFLIDTFYIEYLLKPFYRIVDTKIRRVNEPDAFDHTPINSTTADFRELDEVLNDMMARINTLFRKEKQFISNVSHELLTPISLLKNRFENLLQNQTLDDEAVDKIAASLRTLDMVKKIINNLLLISRIDNNQYEADETIDIKELVDELAVEIEDRVAEKEIDFWHRLDFDFQFRGNKTLLHILFYNLLSNAIKYNHQKGSIIISDGYSDGNYFMSITDTGIGMEAEQVGKIFERFTRLNSDLEGQGIGLAIVDSIAHFHNIAIAVSSELKKGTIVVLTFPELK
ncbi:MAG TPA: HAMP domain-containing sensor histidine kinase [Flavobacterium sp.]|nr:HAMP domain-containing sensor histidine kinase [Flavobacterium sp.]